MGIIYQKKLENGDYLFSKDDVYFRLSKEDIRFMTEMTYTATRAHEVLASLSNIIVDEYCDISFRPMKGCLCLSCYEFVAVTGHDEVIAAGSSLEELVEDYVKSR